MNKDLSFNSIGGKVVFNDLMIKNIYRTKKDNFNEEFIIPLLQNCKIYYRGTGYFNIDALINISKGLIPFIKNGGDLKLITSVKLDFAEIDLLDRSFRIAEERIEDELLKEINVQLSDDLDILRLDLITNLIAAKRIQIKVAYLPEGGLYHEKIGYMEDFENHKVCFIGSNNFTFSGQKRNVETISVIKSWENCSEDTEGQKRYFESLWTNDDEDIRVFDFPEAAKNKLFSLYKESESYEEAIEAIENYYNNYDNHLKQGKHLYDYQKKAIEEFCNNKFCHFFEMATGTGKTFTAVKAVEKLSSIMGDKHLYVSVVVPQIDLQNQWRKEFESLEIKTYCFGGNSTSNNWEDDLANSIIDYHTNKKIVVSICIYDTFFSKINDNLKNYKMNKLLIVDEAHELSANQVPKLTEDFRFRLGLSATPERHDEKETKQIIKYFTRGNIPTFKYPIDEAIEKGFLSHYLYYPIYVHMDNSESEFGQYQRYTKQLALLLNEEILDLKKIKEVCNNRSLIVKKTHSKIEKIQEMTVDPNYSFKNSVVYCGQGKDFESDDLIINNVSKALAFSGNYVVSQFTSKTKNRPEILEEFERGYYDTLVAIKCFDQGVDVPKLDKIYIMASDSTRRQTIQRRGRVLRICKETGKEIAYIYDLVTLPPIGCEYELGASTLVANEIKRMSEYGRLANNSKDIKDEIKNLINEYGVTEDSCDEKETYYG